MGGKITLATSNKHVDPNVGAMPSQLRAGDYAVIEISDTGTGIPSEIIANIFEPYFTTKAVGKGTGLGLAMAFGFVKQSDGHLSVESEPGRGTTFRLSMPRANDSDQPTFSEPRINKVAGGVETVLVVEDDPTLRRAVARQLTELGYRVREAELADAALGILMSEDQVDLLFTDLMMAGTMDGFDLAAQSVRLRPNLGILLTSGFPGARAPARGLSQAPFCLLTKPYRRDQLATAVRAALDSRPAPAIVTASRPVS
jgi:CheY-like chemotaxis protein